MRQDWFARRGLLIASALIADQGAPAQATNVVSRAIEQAQPCRSIKTTKLGVTIGVDNFKSAELESLKIDVVGDAAKIALVGSLACRTSDAAMYPGDASGRFNASAQFNLASCAISEISAQILSTGGTYGGVVEALKGQIENAVQNSISDQVKALCR